MDQRIKNIIIALALLLFGFLVYSFSYIVTYILLAAVLSLLGRPVARKFHQLKISRYQVSKSGAALLTVLSLWIILLTFFGIFIPLIVSEVDQLSAINVSDVVRYLNEAMNQLKVESPRLASFLPQGGNLEGYFQNQLTGLLNMEQASRLFGSLANVIGNLFLMIFSVSFILYYFLKEETLFRNWILVLAPVNYETRVTRVMDKIGSLLKRYLMGMLIQVACIMVLSVLGFSLIGMGFGHAVVVGVFAGLLNVIPYVGPWIAAIFGLVVAIANHLDANFMAVTLPLMGGVLAVVMVVQFLDNMVLQTIIYSSSVHAHPLEVFFVILIAGGLAGIPGMILAIPSYTVIRVIAGEFFSEFKLVQQLTPKE